VVGEKIRIEGEGQEAQAYTAVSRLPSHMKANERLVGGIRWEDGPMEIEHFHDALVKAAGEHLAPLGGPWGSVSARFQSAFRSLGRTSLQQATRTRLEALVRSTGGVPGSLFIVESGAVLDHLMDALFTSGGDA
jgi:hypothetical protein